MDGLTGLLDGPRARGAFLLRSVFEPPWSLRIEDEAALSVVALVQGEAWITPQGGDPVRLAPGDIAIARGPDPYVVSDHPDTPPAIIIGPGQVCTTLYGEKLAEAMDLGVRTWGNDLHGSTTMVTGTYEELGEVGRRLLDALPPLVHVPGDDCGTPLVGLFAAEMVREVPGQGAVLDRLLDVLLIAALRSWFGRPDAEAPAWYRANSDPIVGRALRTMQNQPAEPWTVSSLASCIGVSRATLARRFADLVGEGPMSFLTGWRLSLAADLLREPEATIGSVARQVGYSTPFALSTAFKRSRGVSPQQFRRTALASA